MRMESQRRHAVATDVCSSVSTKLKQDDLPVARCLDEADQETAQAPEATRQSH